MNVFPRARTHGLPVVVAAAVAVLLSHQPAQAHGLAHGGLAAGFLHPLTGIDHLLLLVAVGAAAASLSVQLLLWGLAGAVAGGIFGALGGALPAAEALAALAIPGVALLVLTGHRSQRSPALGLCGTVVATAVAVHAILHGQEAPGGPAALLWWTGAFLGSVLVGGGSFLVLRRLPTPWAPRVALVLAVLGGGLALAPIGILAR